MGAEYLFYMKSIETHARLFLALIILSIGTVGGFQLMQILGLLDMYFESSVVYVTKLLLLFRLAIAILWAILLGHSWKELGLLNSFLILPKNWNLTLPNPSQESRRTRMLKDHLSGSEQESIFFVWIIAIVYLQTRTTDTQWRRKSKISEKLGWCGRQNMLRPYLKIWDWDWDWIFGRAVKAISSLGVRSPCLLWSADILVPVSPIFNTYEGKIS